jgi:hypothetical protein
MKKLPLILSAWFAAALLSSCSPLHPDVRPEVAQPLNEAVHLSGYWSPDGTAILAKLNQAASVPNLNSDEQNKIRDTTIATLARVYRYGFGNIPGAERGAPQTETNSGPRDSPMPSMGSVQH